MRFEWNEDRSRNNRKKHGVAFEAAVKVFNDPFLLLIEDGITEGEQRWHAIGAAEAAILLVVHVYRTRVNMAKKTIPVSSRRARLTSVSAESILTKPLNKRQKANLDRIAKRQAADDDSRIDYSDIPALTEEQLANAKRAPKVLVAARLDREVVDWLKKFGEGYSTRINFILREAMSRVR